MCSNIIEKSVLKTKPSYPVGKISYLRSSCSERGRGGGALDEFKERSGSDRGHVTCHYFAVVNDGRGHVTRVRHGG